jgi:hypothetical protein
MNFVTFGVKRQLLRNDASNPARVYSKSVTKHDEWKRQSVSFSRIAIVYIESAKKWDCLWRNSGNLVIMKSNLLQFWKC